MICMDPAKSANIWSIIRTDACLLGLGLSAIIIALLQQKTENMLLWGFKQGWTLHINTISFVLYIFISSIGIAIHNLGYSYDLIGWVRNLGPWIVSRTRFAWFFKTLCIYLLYSFVSALQKSKRWQKFLKYWILGS